MVLGDYLLPAGTKLVTPVFGVYCGECVLKFASAVVSVHRMLPVGLAICGHLFIHYLGRVGTWHQRQGMQIKFTSALCGHYHAV